jgi:hypothetical protein
MTKCHWIRSLDYIKGKHVTACGLDKGTHQITLGDKYVTCKKCLRIKARVYADVDDYYYGWGAPKGGRRG